MVEMAILGAVVSTLREMHGMVWWLSFLRNVGGDALYIPGEVFSARSYILQSLCGSRFP